MDKFEVKEILKKRLFIKNTWCDWLINYISMSIRKAAGGLKKKV